MVCQYVLGDGKEVDFYIMKLEGSGVLSLDLVNYMGILKLVKLKKENYDRSEKR